jgi:hypothetical protein
VRRNNKREFAVSQANNQKYLQEEFTFFGFVSILSVNARPVWLMAESLLYSRSTIRKPYILELSTRVSFSSISHKSARM